MATAIKTLMLLLVCTALLSGPALGKKPLPMPAPSGTAPQWVSVPAAPGVLYAPNLSADLFCYEREYYYYCGGLWYRAGTIQGPWVQVPVIPKVFYSMGPAYFHSPPGWAKGRKTGWGGAPMPPGQMKKYEGGKTPRDS